MSSNWRLSGVAFLLLVVIQICRCRSMISHPTIQPQHLFLSPVEMHQFNGSALPKPSYFRQKLDHFDMEDDRVFWQKFYINDEYWKDSNGTGPVFLLVGGESAVTPYDVFLGHVAELGKRFKALLIVVEHRYYGESIPNLPDMSVENLKYLTWMQALEDLAHFLDHLRPRLEIGAKNPIITFGGSYAGALSAWFRMKFPSQVFGAVASSAPVRARKDFSSYMREVGRAFADDEIGGSQHCQERIRQAFREIERIADKNNGIRTISTNFKSCTPLDQYKDYSLMLQSLASFFQEAVQYNNQAPLNVAKICNLFNGHANSALEHLTDVLNSVISAQKLECYDYSWKNYIKSLSNTTFEQHANERQWTFQFCTQFGYYQQCDPDQGCIFSSKIDQKFYSGLCFELFGLTEEKITDLIRDTNARTGGYLTNAYRVMYVNGGLDPWRILSVIKDQRAYDQDAVLISGASHCEDMRSSQANDTEAMRRGRQHMAEILQRWLQEAADQSTDPVQ